MLLPGLVGAPGAALVLLRLVALLRLVLEGLGRWLPARCICCSQRQIPGVHDAKGLRQTRVGSGACSRFAGLVLLR